MNLIAAINLRTLLISLLLYEQKDNLFVISTSDQKIKEKLENKGYLVFNMNIVSNINFFSKFIEQLSIQKKFHKFLMENGIVNSIDNYIGFDHVFTIMKFMKKECKYIVIEEGLGNYQPKFVVKKLFRQNLIKKIGMLLLGQTKFFDYIPYGYNDRVNEVILTGLCDTPELLKSKAKIISLDNLWDSVNNSTKIFINNLFSFKPNKYDNKIVVLTQPFDNASDNKKISFYNKYVEDTSEYVIKIHPREKDCYSDKYTKLYVDSNRFPFELIRLNKVVPRKIITIQSTASKEYEKLCKVEYIMPDFKF